MEEAWAHRGGEVHLLALDWRKAFDSINASGLLSALKRFGLPDFVVEAVAAIYSELVFHVKENSSTSQRRQQHAGICQGCSLSPFLFIIVMTVLMKDATDMLQSGARDAINEGRFI